MSLPVSRRFSCAAVEHPKDGTVFAAVTAPAELRAWPDIGAGFSGAIDCATLKSGQKQPKPAGAGTVVPGTAGVNQLHVCPIFPGVAAVFTNGSVAYFDLVGGKFSRLDPGPGSDDDPELKPSKRVPNRRSGKVIWSTLVHDQKAGTARLLVLSDMPGLNFTSFRLFRHGAELRLDREAARELKTGGAIMAASFEWPQTLYTINTGGELIRHRLGRGGAPAASSAEEAAPETPEPEPVLKLGSLQLNESAAVLMATLKSAHLLVAGSETGSGRPVVLLINTLFGSLQGYRRLDSGSVQLGTARAGRTLVGVVPIGYDCVLAATGSAVLVCRVNDSALDGTLLAALGSSTVTAGVLDREYALKTGRPSVAHTANWPHSDFDGWGNGVAARDATLRGLAAKLVDQGTNSIPAGIATAAAFDDALAEYIRGCAAGMMKKGAQKTRKFDKPERFVGAKISPHYAVLIANAALAETRYFPLNALVRLVKLGVLSHPECPGLLDAATRPDRTVLLRACLRHLSAIDAPSIMMCLETVHARSAEVDSGFRDDPMDAGDSGQPPVVDESEFATLVRHMICRPCNEQDVVAASRSLSIGAVTAVIALINTWLQKYNEHQHEVLEKIKIPGQIPDLEQLAAWLGYVVDAHFPVQPSHCRPALRVAAPDALILAVRYSLNRANEASVPLS